MTYSTIYSKNIKNISLSMIKPSKLLPIIATVSALLFSTASMANTGVDFVSQDWQVACDNTLTCRLAGYQAENNSELPVSVLIVRRAGANADVEAKVKLGGAKDSSSKALMKLGDRHRLSLFINDRDYGETQTFSTATGDAEFTSAQTKALLDALTKSSKIELVLRNSRWQLSDKGASAVMLKADDVQGRVGTSSAFIDRNGVTKPNSSVLSPKPVPKLNFVTPNPKAVPATSKRFAARASQLATLMNGTMKDVDNDCPNLSNNSSWVVNRLNGSQLLVQHECWTGAYNVGTGMWVMNDSKPYKPTLVTTSATNYNKGKISSLQKGRGIGDCMAKKEWVWTGKAFEQSYEGTTGLCRLIEAGGAWQLPTYITDVKSTQ